MTHVVRVQYDGGLAGDGRMSAADLASAIMGMANMVSGTSEIVLGDDTRVQATVRTDFGGNSFVVVFEILSVVADLLSSADSVVSLLGFSENSNGLIQTLQWLRGRTITSVGRTEADDPASSFTVSVDGDKRELSVSDVRVLRDDRVVKGALALMEPLLEGNATRVTIGNGDKTTVPRYREINIEEAEARNLRIPVFPDDEVVTSRYEMTLTVVAPVFRGDYVWRFQWSGTRITARMLDDDFISRIRANRVAFGYGDSLRVQMETDEIQRKSGGVSYRHRIVKVLGHKRQHRYEQDDLLTP